MGIKDRPQCYFDVEINREPVGRIVFQLFSDICPKTSKNFLCLCTGEKGTGKVTGKKLCYKGSTFHRVVKSFMIQGGDFTEGNGRGGESIFGGYFEDENFSLKHDRAFLLSMANRGKDTNGSQFFITTKMAPHLDGVHVVFGLVISGFEVIRQIENLKTDAASRPYADVRVIDCGELITKSNVLGNKKKVLSHSSDSSISSSDSSSSSSSSSESDSDSEEKYKSRKRKRQTKNKHSKRRRKEGKRKENHTKRHPSSQRNYEHEAVDEEKEKDLNMKREKPVVRPEEIPPVPENRFLLRRDMPVQVSKPETAQLENSSIPNDLKPAVTKSGRKIKGRGTMRYHTPPRSRSRSKSEDDGGSSETPPHWKEEMQRTKTYKPPTGEKWSKGDKLNDHYSSRWDNRSASPWSRSWSHECFSDHSTERSSQPKRRRKEKKKAKHKKKSKKQKHSKRRKILKSKPKDSPLSENGSSLYSSRISKFSSHRERRSRSFSTSSRRLSREEWSDSDKVRHSSPSSRDSHSYTRSKTRSKSYSRSKSRTRSRSSSRSRSVSRSRSQSRSRRRTASRSPRKAKLNKSSKAKVDHPKLTTLKNEKVVKPEVSESVPVLPLSDSPPPSRWKPGQKPWKPSYVRIQEIKAKTAPTNLVQAGHTVSSSKENDHSSHHSQHKTSDSERSSDSRNYSNRSYKYSRRSRSRSSRSRSYSRSCSRSKTRSHSRSRSHSPLKSESLSSSYSRSDSYDSYKEYERKKNSSERKEKHVSHVSSPELKDSDNYVTNSKKRDVNKETQSLSSSESTTDSENAEIDRKKQDDRESKIQNTKSASLSEVDNVQTADPKHEEPNTGSVVEEKKSKSEWDSDSDSSRKKTSVKDKSSEAQHIESHRTDEKDSVRKVFPMSKWDTESETEGETKKSNVSDSKLSSGKEEGEASSESESEGLISLNSKTSGNASSENSDTNIKSVSKTPSVSVVEGSNISTGSEKPKTKKKAKRKHKHKKRSSAKADSDRTKAKSKSKKAKRKTQKRKETFHWQPPLEFGEEEDDEEEQNQQVQLKKNILKESAVKPNGGHSSSNSEDKESKFNTDKSQVQSKEVCSSQSVSHSVKDIGELTKKKQKSKQSSESCKKAENTEEMSNKCDATDTERLLPKTPEKPDSSDDTMEICTPEPNTPERDHQISIICGISEMSEIACQNSESSKINTESEYSLKTTPVEKPKMQQRHSMPPSTLLVNNGPEEENVKNEVPGVVIDPKWKPLMGISNQQSVSTMAFGEIKTLDHPELGEFKPHGLRIEIKSKSRVRPGSLFDEVRKTARLNQRPRNQESSSEERSPSVGNKSKSRSRTRSLSKSRSVSSQRTRSRTRSLSYSRSRTRSRSSSYSYRSRSYSRSRSRRRYSRDRSLTRSSTYRSYRSHSSRTSSRSHSRSRSYDQRRRSRSHSYDSDYSRSSWSSRRRRSYSYRKSRSYDRRSRSYRSYSRSDRSYSRHRSRSASSRYS
nr:PREDICTED: NK-tumor recognition protein isoform X3 [Lepisosteus oculatus]